MKSGLLIFLLIISNALVFSSVYNLSPSVSIDFLDVGQGDGNLIRANDTRILIDVGPGRNILSALDSAMPRGDKYIDLIIISHPHLDHYGGLEYILKNYEVGAIAWNGSNSVNRLNAFFEIARERNIPVINLFAGSVVRQDKLNMRVVYPPYGAAESLLAENDGSLVIFADVFGLSSFFTGDIGVRTESIISAIDFPDIDILKIPHHGSRTSSSRALLSATNPLVAVLSVGRNSYGLPDEDVLARYVEFNIPVFRTDKSGSVRITEKNNKLRVQSLHN